MKIFAETDRLIMRELLPSDAAGIFALDSDPEVHRYLGNNPIKTIEQAEAAIAGIRQQYETNGIGRWAVIDKSGQEFVGWSGLKYETQIRSYPYYDLGYRLRPKFWKQGIATETAQLALAYGFNTLGWEIICAAADPANIGSNRVLQKIGMQAGDPFEFEGMMINWYELTQSQWQNLQV